MHDNFNLLKIQNELGYVFKDSTIIKAAFIHRSFEAKGEENNVRLAFIGGKLLSFVIADYVASRLPFSDEKQLQYQSESYISALGTERFIREKGLTSFVMLSSLNEPLRQTTALAKELFLAIIGAIYRDGGIASLKAFLLPLIRACDGDDRYRPTTDGHVISRESDVGDGATHVKSERLRRPAKNASISISKAETVKDEPKKKESPVSKLLKKKEEAPVPEKTKQKKEKHPKTEAPAPQGEADETALKRSFIRDPFAPVRLSDDLRNFKPKKPSKYEESPKPTAPIEPPVNIPKAVEPMPLSDDENYKSLLQEYVQKNVRTANVLLKYGTTQTGRGKWSAEVTLDGKKLSSGAGDSKKEAEKNAAKLAYAAITDKRSIEHKWFSSLSTDTVTTVEPSTDYVSRINQHYQKLNRSSAVPLAYEKRHSGKRKEFLVAVVYDGKEIACGRADNIKEAKQNAAKEACEKLGIK